MKPVLVHVVDTDERRVVAAWRVHATTAPPEVTKTYDVVLPVNRGVYKKIGYTNLWADTRSFVLRSSSPAMLHIRDPTMTLAPRSKGPIRLWFAPNPVAETRDFYVFVNNSMEQSEECMHVRAQYQL